MPVGPWHVAPTAGTTVEHVPGVTALVDCLGCMCRARVVVPAAMRAAAWLCEACDRARRRAWWN